MTWPVLAALSWTMGAALALVDARRTQAVGRRRAASLWALLLVQGLVVVPGGALLLWLQPEWSWMYLVVADEASPGPLWAGALAYPGWAVLGWLAAQTLWNRGERRGATWLALGGLCIAAAIPVGLARHVGLVGRTLAFHDDGLGLVPLQQTQLAYLHAVFLPGLAAAVGVAWWRLRLFVAAGARDGGEGGWVDTRVPAVGPGEAAAKAAQSAAPGATAVLKRS